MTHYTIKYMNGNNIMTVENRTHETNVLPSIKMVVNALHSIALNNNVTDFEYLKAEIHRNDAYLCSYRLNDLKAAL